MPDDHLIYKVVHSQLERIQAGDRMVFDVEAVTYDPSEDRISLDLACDNWSVRLSCAATPRDARRLVEHKASFLEDVDTTTADALKELRDLLWNNKERCRAHDDLNRLISWLLPLSNQHHTDLTVRLDKIAAVLKRFSL